MPTAGPTICGTGANDAGFGDVAWAAPTRITADDASYTQAALNNQSSQRLRATNFGFAIPAGATITSIFVEYEYFVNTNAANVDTAQSGLIEGGNLIALDTAEMSLEGTTPTVHEVQTTAWSPMPSVSQVNSASFGYQLVVYSGPVAVTLAIDFVRMTVTYTLPADRVTGAVLRRAQQERRKAIPRAILPAVGRLAA